MSKNNKCSSKSCEEVLLSTVGVSRRPIGGYYSGPIGPVRVIGVIEEDLLDP